LNGLEERDPEKIFNAIDKLLPIAKELNVTLAQLAIAWTIKNPNVSSVITGSFFTLLSFFLSFLSFVSS